MKRLRAFEISDDLGNGDFSTCEEAANRIEELEKHFQHAIAIFSMMRTELYVVGEIMREFPSE